MRGSTFSLVLAGLAVSACSQKAPERPAPFVVTAVAQRANGGGNTLSGDVRARFDSTLSFRVGGQIVDRPVRRGQTVRRGQVLARLDTADVQLGVAEARAQANAAVQAVSAARSLADRAAADERRLRPLVGLGGIAPQQYDATRAAATSAAAELAAAQARLAAARTGVGRANNQARYATLVADADGVVGDLLAEPGQVVAPGQPIVRIARSGGRDAVVAVPEMQRSTLPRVAVANVFGGGRYRATLRELAGVADSNTRTFEARFALEGPGDLPVGGTVTLKLGSGGTGTGTTVPLGALIDRGKGSAVWTIGRDMKVVRRPVTIASIDDNMAVISAGLRPGERIVALGAHMLTQGQRVRIGALPR